ncbi:hypothetical protein GAH_01061 [Geoglobus ahangari]|uniref:Uncharacterized protein n=1 Tax=Geoglobus ahangari TaxID=113653 RepID=A0A0F7IHY0_9EURY|nr:hypothetical protein [Geoglobus ahangari]AKG91619.1 hypothetical protein GAH_01061 [Geoglobus ahangari]
MSVIDLSGIERARRQYVDMILRAEFIRADKIPKTCRRSKCPRDLRT